VRYASGEPETYLVLLARAFGDRARELCESQPHSVIAGTVSSQGSGVLYDALFHDAACQELLGLVAHSSEIVAQHGVFRGSRAPQLFMAAQELPSKVRRSPAEQSNSSVLFGDRCLLKLFRRQEPGPNPDCEIGQYLTWRAGFDRVPAFMGSIEYAPQNGESSAAAMLQAMIAHEGDGWKLTLEELERFYEENAPVPFPPDGDAARAMDLVELAAQPAPQAARDHVGIYLESAAALGRGTAELHMALASPTADPAFAPEPLTPANLNAVTADLRRHASATFDLLKDHLAQLPDDLVEIAALLLSRRRNILDRFRPFSEEESWGQRIRIHGDYHLGQVLRVKTDYFIIDFEGEPARPLAERRSKQSPLKDVAGMLRSFGYAAYSSLMNYATRRPEDRARLEPWAQLWERSSAAEFLRAYRQTAQTAKFLPAGKDAFRRLLEIHLLDKALYELRYELNNRPTWVRIPLMGLLSLSM